MVGIVILTYNNVEMTISCYEAIKKNIIDDYKCYIVENGSHSQIKQEILSYFESKNDVEVVDLVKNRGYTGGNNKGIQKAIMEGMDYIAIINNDVIVKNDIISKMKKYLKNDIGVVLPRTINNKGHDNQILWNVFTLKSIIFNKKPFSLFKSIFKNTNQKIDFSYNENIEFYGMGVGCCKLMKSDTWKAIGLYDENLKFYCEEMIIAKKLSNINLKAFYCCDALICHECGTTLKHEKLIYQSIHQNLGRILYVNKYLKNNKFEKSLYTFFVKVYFSFLKLIKPSNIYNDFFKQLKDWKSKGII